MDEKLLEKLDELIQELSCMNGNLEALAGCVDADEGRPRLLIGGHLEKYDWMAVQNARTVQRRMAGVSEQNRRNGTE